MGRSPFTGVLAALAMTAAAPTLSLAQSAPAPTSRESGAGTATGLSTAKPGRDPNQPIDEAYTKKIQEYTTESFFLSPLVDYLPASRTVPTPKAVLGDIAGAPNKLPYSKEVYDVHAHAREGEPAREGLSRSARPKKGASRSPSRSASKR